MSTALIGHTGFVGSNIARQIQVDEFFNSKNIDSIEGKSFDLVICAGVPAVKWWANQNPEEDLAIIQGLAQKLNSIKARRFVLISTIDVYPEPIGVNESTAIDIETVTPYGKHRLFLEKELENNFENFHVIRLPGLFGRGLKKNILFDMLCHNILEKINLESSFQWYPLSHIGDDIKKIIAADLSLVNIAVEPVTSYVIKEHFFSDLTVGTDPFPVASYDMQSLHCEVFSKPQGSKYILSSNEVLKEMEEWLKNPEVKYG